MKSKKGNIKHRAKRIEEGLAEVEWIRSVMKEKRGVCVGTYFLEPKPGTFAFDVFKRGRFDLPPTDRVKCLNTSGMESYKNKSQGFILSGGAGVLLVFDDASALYLDLPEAKEHGTRAERHAYRHIQEVWKEYSQAVKAADQRGTTLYLGPKSMLRFQQWALWNGPGGELAQKTLGLFSATGPCEKEAA